MRLIGQVKRLEGAAAALEAQSGGAVGVVWTRHESRVYANELQDGEYIAVDVTITRAESDKPAYWSIAERVTLDAGDLGRVFDASGELMGRVVSIDPDLVRVDLAAGGGFAFQRSPGEGLGGYPVSSAGEL